MRVEVVHSTIFAKVSWGKRVLEELLEELLELFKSSGIIASGISIHQYRLMTSVGKAPSKNSRSPKPRD
jgi:hypothetical protein